MKPYRDENGKMLRGENCYHNQDGSCSSYKKRSSCGGCIPADPKIFGDAKNLEIGKDALIIDVEIGCHAAVGYIAGSGGSHVKVYCQQCKYIRIVQKNTFGGCPPRV